LGGFGGWAILRWAQPSAAAEGWTAVAAGQTQPPLAAQGRANSELRNSPTRPQGGAAPKKQQDKKEENLSVGA